MRNSGQHGASSGQFTMLMVRRPVGGHTLVPELPPMWMCSGYKSGGTLLLMRYSAVFGDEGSWGRVSSPLQSSGASVSWKGLHVCTGMPDVRVIVTWLNHLSCPFSLPSYPFLPLLLFFPSCSSLSLPSPSEQRVDTLQQTLSVLKQFVQDLKELDQKPTETSGQWRAHTHTLSLLL